MNNNNPYILVLGASIVDIIGFSKREFKAKDSNPGAIKISLGGVCRNIAENLARVGVKSTKKIKRKIKKCRIFYFSLIFSINYLIL